ncbi:hypothetical protein ACQX23_04295, partial [Corynebacterium diphtheriae]
VQFSKTLIDFHPTTSPSKTCWGSVLKNPDRLRQGDIRSAVKLGFSSQKPDRLQVAKNPV